MKSTALVLMLALMAVCAFAQEPTVVPAVNEPPTDEVGELHYAFEDREPTRPATFTFEDLAGWSVALIKEAQGGLVRTREARLYSDSLARVDFTLPAYSSRVEVRPPEPIELAQGFDCVNVWARAKDWYVYAEPPIWPMLSVRVRDASGELHEIDLTRTIYKDWFLAHKRLVPLPHSEPPTKAGGGDGNGRIDEPAFFDAFIISGTTSGRPAALYLDHVSFYHEELPPLEIEAPDPRGLFPTTPDGILPACHAEHDTSLTANERGATFAYRGEDGTLLYRVELAEPGFDGITARWEDGPVMRPMFGGGPRIEVAGAELAPGDEGVTWEVLDAAADDGAYTVRWRMRVGDQAVEGRTEFRLKGKSLEVTLDAPGGEVVAVDAGAAEGLDRPRVIRVPFLTSGGEDPHVLLSGETFASALFDHYVTNASQIEGAGAVLSASSARFAGRVAYKPKTDGLRNDCHERIFVTVSPTFDEVLPSIPNPRNPYAEQIVDSAWWDVGLRNDDLIRRMYRWGMRGAMMQYNGVIWERGTDFTRRSFYSDGGINVGAEQMAQFGEWVQGLGYMFGLHTNYCIVPPGTHRLWDEDLVVRDSDGEWLTGWGRSYAIKPTRVHELQDVYTTLKEERFGVSCEYTDQTTAFDLGRLTDYDARVPMAGMLRGQFQAYGLSLWEECTMIDGPVLSEGPRHWPYAGLVAGNYGQLEGTDEALRPMLMDFDLLKIHPLECDAGIGHPTMFWRRDQGRELREAGVHSDFFDRWIAWTLAAGHIAQPARDFGDAGLIKSFCMVQPAGRHYALVPVERIGYFDGERVLSTSDAIRSGAYERSQIEVRYANGLVARVNGSWHDDWPVEADGRAWLLPPAGWLLERPGELLEYSALVGSRRVDYVESQDALYLDSRGGWFEAGALATDGAAVVYRDPDEPRVVWVAPATEAGTIAFDPAHFGLNADRCAVMAWDFEREIGEASWRRIGGMVAVDPEEGVAAYRVLCGEGDGPASDEPMPEEPALDVALSPRSWGSVPTDEPLRANIMVTVAERIAEEPVRVSVGGEEVVLPAGEAVRTSAITLPAAIGGVTEVELTASAGGWEVRRTLRLVTSEAEAVLVDLMDTRISNAWGYRRRGQEEVVATSPSGPGYTRFQRSSGSAGGVQRRAIAAPPSFGDGPHGYVFGEYTLALPERPADLAFGIGINETATSPDGVVFSVALIDAEGVRHELFEAQQGNGPWRDERVSLAEWAGEWVTLRFTADCGPADNASNDSARWAEPRLLPRKEYLSVRVETSEGE